MLPRDGSSSATRRVISSPIRRASASVSPGTRRRNSSMRTSSVPMAQNPLSFPSVKPATLFGDFALQAPHEVAELQWRRIALGGKECSKRCKFDLRAGGVHAFGQNPKRRVERVATLLPAKTADNLAPEFQPLCGIRLGELKDVAQAPDECRIDVAFLVRRQQRDAGKTFNGLQQIGRVRVRKLVLGIMDLAGPLAENGIAFVEQDDRVHVRGAAQEALKVLGSLSDPFAYDSGQIYSEQVIAKHCCHDLCNHGLTSSRRTAQQGHQRLSLREEPLSLRAFPKGGAMVGFVNDVLQGITQGRWRHEVVPRKRAAQQLREISEAPPRSFAHTQSHLFWRLQPCGRGSQDVARLNPVALGQRPEFFGLPVVRSRQMPAP